MHQCIEKVFRCQICIFKYYALIEWQWPCEIRNIVFCERYATQGQ